MSILSKYLSKELNTLLWKVEETVSTAESCTGGEIAATLTKIAGSSNYFKGGIVVYTDESKEKFLGVNPETIEKYTVYSEEVVKEMVKGCCEAFNTTYAIAVSGVAGPTGSLPGVPVGTIWIAVGTKDEVRTYKRTEDESRERNIEYATTDALQMLYDFVIERHQEEQLPETE